MRGTGTEVHVVAVRHHAAVIVRVPYYRPVRQPMFVFVFVFVFVCVCVIVPMRVMVGMFVAAVRPMHVVMHVFMAVLVVIVPVHGAVGMPMLVSVLVALDLRFAAAAAAGRAHTVLLGPPQATSISFTRISSPCVTCS